jgi:hypothetical protein
MASSVASYNNDIIKSMADSFVRIEARDIIVGTVQMPINIYENIINSGYISPTTDRRLLESGNVGEIWGTNIIIGDRFEVKGDPGFEHVIEPVNFFFNRIGNLSIIVRSRGEFYQSYSKNEWKALSTLRDMISESDFRRFLKFGFITVRGSTGKIYQIFRRNFHIKVWDKNKVVCEICSYIRDDKIPLTDKLIAFKTIIEADENSIYKMGNVYSKADAA